MFWKEIVYVDFWQKNVSRCEIKKSFTKLSIYRVGQTDRWKTPKPLCINSIFQVEINGTQIISSVKYVEVYWEFRNRMTQRLNNFQIFSIVREFAGLLYF